MTTVGVCLSGCGVYDGSEIYESVLTLLALDHAGVDVLCMAPNVPQMHVIDHRTGEPTGETRNVLTEAARICRGRITDIADVSPEEIDALIFPGGFCAAKNLSDFAVAGERAEANPQVQRLVQGMLAARKPIGAMCIAPAMLAAALKGSGVEASVTVGTDAATAKSIEAMGAAHVSCPVEEFRVDREHLIVTTPAYMLAGRITEAAAGIDGLVSEVLRLVPSEAGAAR